MGLANLLFAKPANAHPRELSHLINCIPVTPPPAVNVTDVITGEPYQTTTRVDPSNQTISSQDFETSEVVVEIRRTRLTDAVGVEVEAETARALHTLPIGIGVAVALRAPAIGKSPKDIPVPLPGPQLQVTTTTPDPSAAGDTHHAPIGGPLPARTRRRAEISKSRCARRGNGPALNLHAKASLAEEAASRRMQHRTTLQLHASRRLVHSTPARLPAGHLAPAGHRR